MEFLPSTDWSADSNFNYLLVLGKVEYLSNLIMNRVLAIGSDRLFEYHSFIRVCVDDEESSNMYILSHHKYFSALLEKLWVDRESTNMSFSLICVAFC